MPFNHLTYIMKTTSGFFENCHFGMSKLTFKSFQSYNEIPEPGVFHQWHFKLKNFKNMQICLKEKKKKKTGKESSEEILKFYFALFADLNRNTLRISLLLYMLGGCMYLGTCTFM